MDVIPCILDTIDCPHFKVIKSKTYGERKYNLVDTNNFIGVLNMLVGSEAISMTYVRLSYISA